MLTMNKDIKEKWLQALRNGEYKQGREYLRATDYKDNEVKYCCLGVLCDLYAKETEAEWKLSIEDRVYAIGGMQGLLPKEVIDWSGLKDNSLASGGYIDSPFIYQIDNSLIVLNDQKKYNFNQIADVIEKYVGVNDES